MSTVTTQSANEIDVFRKSSRTAQQIVKMNLDGISQEESLEHPDPSGNCANWVMGHLVWACDSLLPLLGEHPVLGKDALQRYARGSAPLASASEALPLAELLHAWDEACNRIDKGLANLSVETLDSPAPFSPTNDPNETVRSLLTLVSFHHAYHAGQLGLLRRVAGKPGAIA